MPTNSDNGWFKEKPLEHARSMRKQPTDVEKKLWYALKNAQLGGPRFRRQHPIGPYIADFACIPAKLIIELDGSQHAESVRDQKRDAYLVQNGWLVLRFWNNQVNESLEGVLLSIQSALSKCPHPSPLPQAGEGAS